MTIDAIHSFLKAPRKVVYNLHSTLLAAKYIVAQCIFTTSMLADHLRTSSLELKVKLVKI